MTKFLNISTDNTMGGNSPSDLTVSSQKAIKDYVDAQIIESGGYHPGILSWEWDDHLRNDVQWLRGDTFSWQDGGVYEQAYNHLVDDYDSANWIIITGGTKYIRASGYDTSKGLYDYYGWKEYEGSDVVYTVDTQSPQINTAVYHSTSISLPPVYANVTDTPFIQETIENITVICRVGTDGHKICLPGQESNVAAIYNATGVAWYYILDTTNQRFKLPRTKFGVTGLRDTVGNYVPESLPDHNHSITTYSELYPWAGNAGSTWQGTSTGTTGNASASNSVYQDGAPVQQRATQMYLYFYVGEFTQTALENTAGITAETLNRKVDKGHEVIQFQAPTSANNYTWYRLYADGWVEQGGIDAGDTYGTVTRSVTIPVEMSDTNYTLLLTKWTDTSSGLDGAGVAPQASDITTTGFRWSITYNSSLNRKIRWFVSGMAQG